MGRRETSKRSCITRAAPQYATPDCFCRIFKQNIDRLYLLSLLLTGDSAIAEKCFAQGFDDCLKGGPVLREWAPSWARRTVICNAVQIMRPNAGEGVLPASASADSLNACSFMPAEFRDVVALPVFERFAFVMSVLERYSNHECSLLMNCSTAQVIAARSRALQQIGHFSGPLALE